MAIIANRLGSLLTDDLLSFTRYDTAARDESRRAVLASDSTSVRSPISSVKKREYDFVPLLSV